MASSTTPPKPLITDEDNEGLTEFVGSRGIMKSCHIFSQTPVSSIRHLINYPKFHVPNGPDGLPKRPLIYICSSAIPDFISRYLGRITTPFILVSGDCDESIPIDIFRTPDELMNFLNYPMLVHWYCQNWVGGIHPKVSQIPIGLDYHTMANRPIYWGVMTSPLNQEELLKKVRESSKSFWLREIKCYANFHFLMNTKYGADRRDAVASIPRELVFYEDKQKPRVINWINQVQYTFVISPHGNGLDCHRTWEALTLGCIPIVKTSPLDPLFEHLPVLIVKSWSSITRELLETITHEFAEKHRANEFKYEKLTLDYWKSIILEFS